MFVRLIGAFVAIVLLVPVAAALSDCSLISVVRLDSLCVADSDRVAAEADQTRDLDTLREQIQHRIEVKSSLVVNLIAGRLTLADVTARFLELDESRPSYMEVLRANRAGATDEERMARNVIDYTHPQMSGESVIFRTLVAIRLEIELSRFSNHSASVGAH